MPFIDKTGKIIIERKISPGQAYGFFNCDAPKADIEALLPKIRNLVQTPNGLELTLIEGVRKAKGDESLQSLSRQAEESGMRYVFEAYCFGADNKKTADELSAVMNQMYQSPLYGNNEPFSGAIVYKQGNKYIFRE